MWPVMKRPPKRLYQKSSAKVAQAEQRGSRRQAQQGMHSSPSSPAKLTATGVKAIMPSTSGGMVRMPW
jgi:hypothetical protein